MDNFTCGYYEYADGEDLMTNGHYVNDFSKLKTIIINNTPIDSYEIAKKASSLEEYCF
jgi:hypothetical protein